MYLVLVFLQADEPPAAPAHAQARQKTAEYNTRGGGLPSATGNRDAHPGAGAGHQGKGQDEMPLPGVET